MRWVVVILREQLSLNSKQLVDEFKMDRWMGCRRKNSFLLALYFTGKGIKKGGARAR